MYDSKVNLLNMCMIYDDCNNYLVLNRIKPDWPGITFPGGHVESNESLTDSIIREVKEETGLDIFNPQLCGVVNWYDKDKNRNVVFLYKTKNFNGKLQSSREGEVYWVNKSEFKNLNWSMGMEDYLKVFLSDDYYEVYEYFDKDEWKRFVQ